MANTLRQREIRRKRTVPVDTLGFISRKTTMGVPSPAVNTPREDIISVAEAEVEVESELSKSKPDMGHLSILNHHLFRATNIPYEQLPRRITLSPTLVSPFSVILIKLLVFP